MIQRVICITVDWDPPPPALPAHHPGLERGPDGQLLRTTDGGYVVRGNR